MNVIERINQEVSIYELFDLADPPVRYKTDKKPCQISCPFHGHDVRPSARVYPDTNTFRCFFCSKSWTPVSFWAETNGWYKSEDKLDIGRAISDLCVRYNISDQTFDWQRKFYQIKSASETTPVVELKDRASLLDYYAWSIAKRVHVLSPEDRKRLQDITLSMWERLDSLSLLDDSWEADLKNWYEDAKIMVDAG
jgi:hypothetical protein